VIEEMLPGNAKLARLKVQTYSGGASHHTDFLLKIGDELQLKI